MKYNKLFVLGQPTFYVVDIDASAFANLYLALLHEYPDAVIRMVRGKKCLTVNSFFDEIAAALQFPYYFGENGPAFDECITDLDWLKGSAYLIMIDDAHLFLRDAPEHSFTGFTELLADANKEWLTPNKYIPRERQPTPFHIVFRCPGSDIDALMQRLAHLNGETEILDPSKLPAHRSYDS